MKLCRKCKTEKPKSDFGFNKHKRDKLNVWCKSCCNKQGRNRTPDYRLNQSYKIQYGITLEDYNKMLEDQNNKCKICGSSKSGTIQHNRLVVDHDHKTGKVRGLLCDKCNRGLGYLGDSIENLEKAVEYLKGN